MTNNSLSKKTLSILVALLLLLSVFTVLKGAPVGHAENTRGGGGDWDQTTTAQETINWDNVNAVIEAIHNIGSVEFTSECQAMITAARDAYDALNTREKREVSNYGDLTDAEAALRNLSQGHNTAVRLIVNGAVDGILDTHKNFVFFGNYNQSDTTSTSPINWRILDDTGGRMLLLSEWILAYKPYHVSSAVSVPWTSCSLRTWLNGNGTAAAGETDDSFFNNAFNTAEQAAVFDTDVNEILSSGGGQGTSGVGNTDKVFILSSAEVREPTFGFPASTAASDTRRADSTVVANNQQGAKIKTWWLRDTSNSTSRWVHNDGQVVASSDTGSYNQIDLRGVRPALHIDLSRVLFASPAVDGKNAQGALATIPVYTGKEWKLTVRNNTYRFSVSETAATAGSGETVTLNYTRAKYGAKDWISAILVDADGHPVYYGQIAQATAAAGSVDITIPQDVTPGNYTLKVFNEQLNGDSTTDAASAFSNVALTVTPGAAVNAVIAKIDAIGEVTYTPACKAKIDDARDAYNALTGQQKAQVTNYAALTAAEAAYAEFSQIWIGAHSLTLDGDIGVNFYAYLPDATDAAYAVFTVDGKSVTVPIDLSKYIEQNGLTLYKFTCDVAAAQIDTEITGVIHNGEIASDEFTYTVQDYLTEAQQTMADDEKFMALASSLATYGFYANELFAFDPAFSQHALFDDSGFAAMTAASLADCAAQINDTADGVTYYGSSLVLRTETAIRHYFTLPAGKTIDEYTFLLGEGDDAVALTPKANGNYYYVEIPNIPSAKLGDPQTVTAIKNTSGAGGTAVGGVIGGSDPGTVGNGYNTGNVSGSSTVVNTWTCSALSYVFKVLTKSEANDPAVSTELINVSKALMLYYQAADVFFSAPEISFRLTDNFGWGQAYVYAWDADGNAVFGEYPGQQAETTVNEYGETQFVIRLPADAVGCFVSNGNGTRTENITDFSYTGYWMDGNQNDQGHYLVTGWY